MKLSHISYQAGHATLGAFQLAPEAISAMPGGEPLEVTEQDLPNILPGIQSKFSISNGGFYLGENPASPAIGDERIHYTVVKPGEFSVVARQSGNALETYPTRAGRGLLLVEAGDVDAGVMFHDAETKNQILTWILRGVGALLMLIGFALLLGPTGALADIIPFVGGLVEMGLFFAAFLLSSASTLFTIAVAWIAVRPMVGGGLLLLAVLALVVAFVGGNRRSPRPSSH